MSSNSYVNITSYTVPNNVQVVANNNTNLAANTETECNQIAAPLANINAQDGFLTPVAEINGKYFTTLQAAINAAAEDETVKLLADVNYSLDPSTFTAKHGDDDAALFVLADDKLTIDLNGNTISVVATLPEGAATAHSGAIINNGDLTIDDSSVEEEGKVTFEYVGIYDDGYKRHGVVMNLGTLTVNAGTLENVTELQNQQAIDNTNYNKTEVSVVINGGTIKSAGYYAIDMVGYYDFAPALKNSVVINDGTIDGGVYARIQNNTNLSLNITGGVIKSDFAEAVRYRVHYPGNTHSISITGGEFSTTNAESQVVRVQLAEGESLAGFISAGTFSQDVNEFCAAGFMCVENDNGTYGVVVDPDYGMVAKIGETRYATLAAAFAAAAQTEELTTIELLPVTIEEDDDINTVEKTIKLPATLKNVIVKGADNNTSILKNLTIQNAQGGTYDMSNITFDGVVFDNSNIVLTGWRTGFESLKNLIVKNCIFRNIVRSSANLAAVHINVAADKAVNGFTFINNVIDGVTGAQNSGIYGQFTGEVIVEDNVINSVAFRPYVIQLTTDDGIDDEFTVTGNTFSGSAAGRAQALTNNAEGTDAVTLTVSNNIFKGITEAQQICYWKFNEATTTATLEKNYYDIDVMANPGGIYYNSPAQNISELSEMGIFPIYKELKEDGTINEESLFNPVAYVGTVAYETLAEAFAGQDGTIVLLKNIELTQGLTVAADKTFTLDLNGKVVSGVSTTAASSSVITNNGNLTVQSSVEGGKITSFANNPDPNGTPAYANNTITNCGVLTLVSGTIENSTVQGLACYPIDNNSTLRDAIVNIQGGVVTGRGAIRQFANSETNKNEVNVTGGQVIGTSYAIWIQNPSDQNSKDVKAALNISAGELGKILLEASAGFEVAISGGTISEVAFWETDVTNPERNPSSFITGGTFGMDVTEFCAFNYVCTQNTDGTYGVQYKPLEDNAFVISNLNELIAFRNAVNAGNDFAGQTVVLSGNVDLALTGAAAENWIPIGTIATPFKGTFDGGDNTISNLVVEGENNVGLFGYADNATIKNVKLENANVKGTDCVGAIAGQVYSTSLIDNCHVSGSIQVKGQTNVGGIVGKYYTKVKNCSVIGDGVATSYVKGTYVAPDLEGDNIAGIMGHGGENNTFENNTVKYITISGTRKVAGIVGVTDQNTDVVNCLVENVNIVTTATAEYAEANKTKAGHAPIVGSYTSADANKTYDGTVIGCTVKNVTFVNDNNVTASFGPITGGAREGMIAPSAGVTASNNNIYMSTITGNTTNMYLMNAVAKIDETAYYTLFDAVAAVQDGETTITMLRSTAEEFAIDNTTANITLDMATYTLTGAITPSKANLTIENGTINNENASYSAIEINAGTLVLNDVNVTSKRHAVRIDGDVEATINGGEYTLTATSGTRHAVNVSGGAEVTIEAGTFVGPKGTTMDSGSAVCVQSGATVTIEGGDFSGGKNATLGVSGTMIVKGGTFDQDVTAYCANGYVCQKNADNKYEVFFAVASITNAEGTTVYYAALQDAVNAAGQNETTIVMIADAEVSETVRVEAGQKITLDLNGKTIDGTEKVRIALMSYGDLTIKDSTEEKNGMIKAGIGTAGNTVNICKGTFTLESANIYSKNNAILIDEQTATVNINGGTITAEPTTDNSAAFYISSTSDTEVNITAGTMKGFNGILLWNNTKINITGGSVIAEGDLAIQGNGSRDNTEINISGENTIITGKDAAIYHPQGGKLNISGGTITGSTGIVVKGGEVTISGGTINGTGEAVAYAPVSSGYQGTGDALYIEHYDNSTDSGNYGTPVVTVTGGTFNSTNAHPIASYANPNNASNGVEALANFISGGAFNKEVEESLLAVGYALTENNGMYEVSFADYIVLPSFMNENNYEDYFGTNTVTDGTNYYATLQAAVEAVVGQPAAILYCKPGANVGSLQHAPVTSTLTVYGNDAYVSGGAERDFDLGNTDPNGGRDITADMTLTVNHLDGCGAWGTKATEHTVNLVFENCDNMGKIFITGQTGILNITMTDCAFEGVIAEALYSNADGNITLTNVDFSNLNKAINLNHKASGTQTVTMTGCTFTDCGNDVSADQIPVRVLTSVPGGKSELTVENCTFTGTPEGGADILLDYGIGLTEATITETNAKVVIERKNNEPEVHNVVDTQEYAFNNLPFVAEVDGTQFTSLQAAINAADGKTVVVLDNITLTETLTVAAGTTVTLDLNGKTVSQTKEQTTGYQMILNDGNLTIVDNTNEKLGKISYTDSGNGGEYVSNTITNRGTITVKSGTIENLSSQTVAQNGYPYAIDSSIWGDASEVNTIVEGGKVHGATYSAIRLRADSNSEPVNVTVSGGEIVGTIEVQVPSSTVAGKGALVISGGKLSNSGTSNVLFFFGSGASAENIEVSVTGGEFTGNITISSSYPIGDNFNNNFITGGTFSTDVNEYCHEYYDAIQGDDNLWRVEQVLFAQTREFTSGWNWFSSYINLAKDNGLSKLQNAIVQNYENGVGNALIKGQTNNQSVQYDYIGTLEGVDYYDWTGNTFAPVANKMYMIYTSKAIASEDFMIEGEKVDYENTTIALFQGWNWISYPLDEPTLINEALKDFTGATTGDQIKWYGTDFVIYMNGKWYPEYFTMMPGEGYMYKAAKQGSFMYSKGAGNNRSDANANMTVENSHWTPEISQYANNMTITAMLSVDDEIVKGDYEIAAFANGECRGSARPIYVEELDAYVLLMAVFGEDVEELTFKYYDVNYETEYELSNRINYSNDAVVGSIDEPYMFNLDILNIGETSVENISIYPNPTTTGSEINLQAVCDKVEVFNALGVKVAEYTNVDSIDAIETAGVYVIRLTIDNSARNCRLIVK
ncbi:MAG: T9SS type A sorting domain-containing protein [Bacteroidales bacterium]|nr:T9SS type A sorting domain-containing protein [Bacteroidales bacterium]